MYINSSMVTVIQICMFSIFVWVEDCWDINLNVQKNKSKCYIKNYTNIVYMIICTV